MGSIWKAVRVSSRQAQLPSPGLMAAAGQPLPGELCGLWSTHRPTARKWGTGLWPVVRAPTSPVLGQCFGKSDDCPASGSLMIIVMSREARSQGSGVGTGALGGSWLCQVM